MAFKDFTEMPVWEKAFLLLLKVYKVTTTYPKEEKYGLVSDMRRAANSVTNNIAEGFGRFEKRDKTRFYKISRGSSYELINQNLASQALGFMTNEDRCEIINGYKEVKTYPFKKRTDLWQNVAYSENRIRLENQSRYQMKKRNMALNLITRLRSYFFL